MNRISHLMWAYTSKQPWLPGNGLVNRNLPDINVVDVWSSGVRLTWKPWKNMGLSLFGRNFMEDNEINTLSQTDDRQRFNIKNNDSTRPNLQLNSNSPALAIIREE